MTKQPSFYEIYDYIYIPFWKTNFFIFTTLSIIIISLTIILYLLFKRMKAKSNLQKKLTPLEWALAELDKLNPNSYEEKEEFKQFYYTITTIIKTFLEQQYKIDIIEKTDQELLKHLKKEAFPQQLTDKLEEVLQGSLFIKFANAQVLQEQATKDLATVVSLVKAIVPEEEPQTK